jgi:UDP-N-acetylmuramate: L-alanyl-gamma-D-glutamyl-meso-diaminopimelate ligase
MHVHILGICGTFMGGIARLAREMGHRVTGSDNDVYPPMSNQLAALGIEIIRGFDPAQLEPPPEIIIVGNALSRGNPAVEAVLNRGLPYVSGPQWLAAQVLAKRHVVAAAGTHGKTTVASMIAWILDQAKLNPGFLIGGIPTNFEISARLGDTPFFVVEADEYDTAFFDKRSKFIHYHPQTVVLNNLEFDHADIFHDLDDIKRQFNHFIRTVPGNGRLIVNGADDNLRDVLDRGCWSTVEFFNAFHPGTRGTAAQAVWTGRLLNDDYTAFEIEYGGESVGKVVWPLIGRHNMSNALAAVAAAKHAGVPPADACEYLGSFRSVKRRLEVIGERNGIRLYDDFAHHPTEIKETLAALRHHVGRNRIIAIVEPRSNTMRMGRHRQALPESLSSADLTLLFQPPGISWDVKSLAGDSVEVFASVAAIIERVVEEMAIGDHIVIMSNGGFDGLAARLLERFEMAPASLH